MVNTVAASGSIANVWASVSTSNGVFYIHIRNPEASTLSVTAANFFVLKGATA